MSATYAVGACSLPCRGPAALATYHLKFYPYVEMLEYNSTILVFSLSTYGG